MSNKLILLFLLIATSWSCKKTKVIATGFDNSEKVSTVVRGKIVDENDKAIPSATLIMNGKTIIAAGGVFVFEKQAVNKNAQSIKAEAPGYFDMFKTIPNVDGQESFTIIRMQKKTNPTKFNVEAGAFIDHDGVLIELPNKSYVNKSNGKLYTGQVSAYVKKFNTDDKMFFRDLPGGNVGVNATNEANVLEFVSMIGVELEDANGEALQLSNGAEARITMPISSSQQATAPNEIALSHLDETTGLWVEDGKAKRVGNNYVGSVTHFSYWTWNYPNFAAGLFATIMFTDANGNPLIDMMVVSKTTNSPFLQAGSYLNSNGFGVFMVEPSRSYVFELIPLTCPTTIFSGSFSTPNFLNGVANLGTFNIGNNPNIATIQGTTVNCNNAIVGNSKMRLMLNSNYNYILSDANGNFGLSFFSCGGSTDCEILAVADTIDYGIDTFSITSGVNNIGNFACCGRKIPFINLLAEVDSFSGAGGAPALGSATGVLISSNSEFLVPFTYNNGIYTYEIPMFNSVHQSSVSGTTTMVETSFGSWLFTEDYSCKIMFNASSVNPSITSIVGSQRQYFGPFIWSVQSANCAIPINITQYSTIPNVGVIEGNFNGFFYDIYNNKIKAQGNFIVDRNF